MHYDKQLLFLFTESPLFQKYAEIAYVSKGSEIDPQESFYLIDEGTVMWKPLKDQTFPYLPLETGSFFGIPSKESKKYYAKTDCVLWEVDLGYLPVIEKERGRDFTEYLCIDTCRYERWMQVRYQGTMLEQELANYLIHYFSKRSRIVPLLKPNSVTFFSKRRGNKALNTLTAISLFEGINATERKGEQFYLHLGVVSSWLEKQMHHQAMSQAYYKQKKHV